MGACDWTFGVRDCSTSYRSDWLAYWATMILSAAGLFIVPGLALFEVNVMDKFCPVRGEVACCLTVAQQTIYNIRVIVAMVAAVKR